MVDDVGALVLAGLFLFLALAALTLMASLRRTRAPLLAAFACFVALFGARLAAGTQSSRDLLGPTSSPIWIPLPILLATAGLITGRWRRLAQWLVIYQLSFVVVAIGVDLARGRPGSGMRLNNAAVATFLLLTVVYALARRAKWRRALRFLEGRVMAVGLLFFVVVAVGQNLGELGLRPGPRVPEAFALLVLVCCIGYAIRRTG